MATIYQSGYVFKDDGTAVSGATVQLYQTDSTNLVTILEGGGGTSTTTNSDGYYSASVTEVSATSGYDVKITSGSSVRYRRGNDRLQIEELDIRNDTGATQGGLLVANTTNSTANKVATFAGRNTTGATNDEIYISYELHNAAEEVTEFARMTVIAKDATNGSEDGEIQFDVMKNGTPVTAWTLSSAADSATSMDMNVDSFTIGTGGNTDITLTFDATTSDGVITWMEDEDYFKFSDDILMNSTERINFYDTAVYIYSSTDGQLDLVADTEIQIAATTIDINGAVAFDGAITGATNITLSGELDAATLDISGNADIDGTLEADAITINGTAIGSIYGVIAGSSSIVTTGALDSCSITSGFGNINTGSSTITTTGAVATGALTTGTDGSGVDVIFYSGTSGDNLTWDASEEKLVITGTDGANALEVPDGNVSITDNLTVGGTLTVSGTTTTLNTATLTVTDPLIKLAHGTTASPTNDLGLVFTRGNGSATNIANRAILWDESADVFAFANTNDEAGTTTGNVDIDDYASVRLGGLTADDAVTLSTIAEVGSDTDKFLVSDSGVVKYVTGANLLSYIGGGTGGMTSFQLEDDDGTEVTISNAKEVKIIGSGVTTNWTDTDNGTDADPYDLTITVDAAQTGINSLLATDIVIGEDAQTKIDFETANEIHFDADNAERVKIDSTGLNIVSGSLETATIDYTDGDLAMTIADGGGVTFAGNITLGETSTVSIGTPLLPTTDHTSTGLTAEMLAGGAISAFDLVCIHTTTQEVVEADASAIGTTRVIGIAPAAISDTATGTILLQGFIRDDTWNWTPGSPLYLSETAGAMTHTAPTTDGAFVVVVGIALSPDVVYINPSLDIIEHA